MAKVWFITGCSKGFGHALTVRLLKSTNDFVVATARKPESLDDLKSQYKDRLLTLALDVTDATQIKNCAEQAIEKFGRIDVLVNNAGYGLGGTLEECSMKSIRDIFDTNVFGLMEMTKAVLPTMRIQKAGHIFNISSIAGLVGMAGAGIYNSTKFAVEGMSEALAAEVAHFGIKVIIIEPGPFRTDFLGDSFEMSPAHPAYEESIGAQVRSYRTQVHNTQNGDPVKAAEIMIQLAAMENPPLRMLLGNVAMDRIYQKMETQKDEFLQFEELSRSADYDDVKTA
ncbi:MAG: SDR family NAD(P)-dependent oxidoreductase [Alphaproteobacteria bacterium]|nr:SDR family NAD(P)-dependent oxidoreductase [Alphaproteobacteria bacterium]